ncbi:aminotransferase class V-fold PLP-dependent enzyme [Microtetraspora malaysiensis]|uniref:aminotransferase class V-fold PLP-dependent enzyme n=1 Tax=Microtetraspora malaysiensis TaxID=161358 RepID=UPI003D92A284
MSVPPGDEPGDFAALLETFRQAAAQGGDTAGSGYLACFPAGASSRRRWPNCWSGRSTGSPGSRRRLRRWWRWSTAVLTWLASRFGLRPGAGGLIGTGASLATLSAVVAARHDWLTTPHGTVYVTEHTQPGQGGPHRRVAAGLPARRPHDRRPPDGRRGHDRHDRRRPDVRTAPVPPGGTAGTTSTGTVDPLPEPAALARERGLWFHVDAAYGGGLQLTRGRALLDGVHDADLIVFDPHKSLFLPYGTGVLLVRDPATLRAAHSGGGHHPSTRATAWRDR